MIKRNKKILIIIAFIVVMSVLAGALYGCNVDDNKWAYKKKVISGGQYYGDLATISTQYTNEFIVAKHNVMGGSHYAYTEGVSDDLLNDSPQGNESNFRPGSALVKLVLDAEGNPTEHMLIDSPDGVIRDPSVSADGTKVVFSWKKDRHDDDFHLYIYDLTKSTEAEAVTQITFGQGVADFEPQWLPNGKIAFSSTRTVQRVDCWITIVSNIFTCDADGSNIIRLGYDQVHTTFPTVTSDGRLIYTRWDYNDRNQMYVQGVFQMFADGTNQTEVYGNNANFPTTLLHSREVPGKSAKYISVVSGHHTYQAGKLCFIDTTKGANSPDAIEYIFEDLGVQENIDVFAQNGAMYAYPYAINEYEILYSRAPTWSNLGRENTVFSIFYSNLETGQSVMLIDGESDYSAAQISPIIARDLFNRPSTVNYATNKGTYYISNIYEGDGLEGVPFGEAKWLRVVALDYRSYAIGNNTSAGHGTADPFTPVSTANGTWDVKQILGIVEIEADGSVLFSVPSEVPLFFQVLDDKGELIQTMRSWSTLMPNETYSCVGCHEDKNSAPTLSLTTTLAMKKGVQLLIKDLWMTGEEYDDYDPYAARQGFSYMEKVQPIFDNSCVACHNNQNLAVELTGAIIEGINVAQYANVFPMGSSWNYTTNVQSDLDWTQDDYDDSAWQTGEGGFGNTPDTSQVTIRTNLNFDNIYLRRTFNLSALDLSKEYALYWQYDEDPIVYINGILVASAHGYITTPTTTKIIIPEGTLKAGENTIAVYALNTVGGRFIDVALMNREVDNLTGANPVSFESVLTHGRKEKMNYPLSYLVLTGSYMKSVGGNYYYFANIDSNGDIDNPYTNWVSAMSQCEILPAYYAGSSQSYIIQLLRDREGAHAMAMADAGYYITDEEILTIAAWIDMGVPLRGTYDELNTWNAAELGFSEEMEHRRNYYVTVDRLNKNDIAGLADNRKVTVEYWYNGSILTNTITKGGLIQLSLNETYKSGDEIVIKLPSGVQYFYFNIDPRLPISLIYCPSGEFTYKIPDNLSNFMPKTVGRYTNPIVTVYLPSQEDLARQYNLALNPYSPIFTANGEIAYNYYPYVIAGDEYKNGSADEQFMASNAIDGYINNLGHGAFPNQSWGLNQNPSNSDMWLTIDFGRDVVVENIVIYLRADFPHDTHYTEVKIEFSDESFIIAELIKTADGQKIIIEGGKVTRSIKLLDFVKFSPTWAAITEVEVYGTNVIN